MKRFLIAFYINLEAFLLVVAVAAAVPAAQSWKLVKVESDSSVTHLPLLNQRGAWRLHRTRRRAAITGDPAVEADELDRNLLLCDSIHSRATPPVTVHLPRVGLTS